jgi:hypothetical protein
VKVANDLSSIRNLRRITVEGTITTWPSGVRRIERSILSDPKHIVGDLEWTVIQIQNGRLNLISWIEEVELIHLGLRINS